jgi:hypothetical protein
MKSIRFNQIEIRNRIIDTRKVSKNKIKKILVLNGMVVLRNNNNNKKKKIKDLITISYVCFFSLQRFSCY